MNKELIEKVLNICIDNSADFAEVYYEEKTNKSIIYRDSKLDQITTSNMKGVGIRIKKDDTKFYASTNNLTEENIIRITNKLCENIKGEKVLNNIVLEELKEEINTCKMPHDSYPINSKIEILKKSEEIAKSCSEYITQIESYFLEEDKIFIVANTNKTYVKSTDIGTRYFNFVYTKKDDITESSYYNYGSSRGYEFLDEFNYKEEVRLNALNAVDKLNSETFIGGELPVIIGNGFGGVIFHEACGHGFEATTVAKNLSVFSNDLNKTIASEKVTIIDDGTIEGSWGTTSIDTEGNKTKRNVLVENGVLKSFLVDELNKDKMNHKITGSGRRESYLYPPTSRMNNTYLEKGTDTIDDMLKSIELGVYCKTMGGGMVDPTTGNFNFAANDAFLIENGQITKRIKGITLIGNSKDILQRIEMVSSDLIISSGMCGSESGMVRVTVGEPTIKVSKILVGGRE